MDNKYHHFYHHHRADGGQNNNINTLPINILPSTALLLFALHFFGVSMVFAQEGEGVNIQLNVNSSPYEFLNDSIIESVTYTFNFTSAVSDTALLSDRDRVVTLLTQDGRPSALTLPEAIEKITIRFPPDCPLNPSHSGDEERAHIDWDPNTTDSPSKTWVMWDNVRRSSDDQRAHFEQQCIQGYTVEVTPRVGSDVATVTVRESGVPVRIQYTYSHTKRGADGHHILATDVETSADWYTAHYRCQTLQTQMCTFYEEEQWNTFESMTLAMVENGRHNELPRSELQIMLGGYSWKTADSYLWADRIPWSHYDPSDKRVGEESFMASAEKMGIRTHATKATQTPRWISHGSQKQFLMTSIIYKQRHDWYRWEANVEPDWDMADSSENNAFRHSTAYAMRATVGTVTDIFGSTSTQLVWNDRGALSTQAGYFCCAGTPVVTRTAALNATDVVMLPTPPTPEPTVEPTEEPESTTEPTVEPTTEPTRTLEPTFEPTTESSSASSSSVSSSSVSSLSSSSFSSASSSDAVDSTDTQVFHRPTAEPTVEPTAEGTTESTSEPQEGPQEHSESLTSIVIVACHVPALLLLIGCVVWARRRRQAKEAEYRVRYPHLMGGGLASVVAKELPFLIAAKQQQQAQPVGQPFVVEPSTPGAPVPPPYLPPDLLAASHQRPKGQLTLPEIQQPCLTGGEEEEEESPLLNNTTDLVNWCSESNGRVLHQFGDVVLPGTEDDGVLHLGVLHLPQAPTTAMFDTATPATTTSGGSGSASPMTIAATADGPSSAASPATVTSPPPAGGDGAIMVPPFPFAKGEPESQSQLHNNNNNKVHRNQNGFDVL